jgi:hypothetical protein
MKIKYCRINYCLAERHAKDENGIVAVMVYDNVGNLDKI